MHDPTPHPNHETWIAYHAGALSEAEADRLRGHLATCRRCCDLVLDLDAFAEPAAPAPGVADFERAAVWRTVRNARRTRWTAAAALAASLAFAVAGLVAWSERQRAVERLESRIAELSQPRIDAVIFDLEPGARKRGPSGGSTVIDLPADAGAVTLVLNLAEPPPQGDFSLAIHDAEGAEVWSARGLEPSEFDNFYVTLPHGFLPAGRYDLLLSAEDGGRRQLLETYPVRFVER